MKASIPWRVKLGAKLLLARLHLPYGMWSRLNLFKHGQMQNAEYARGVCTRHVEVWKSSGGTGGFACLELGPGDSLFSALAARSLGATRTWMVDAGSWASKDVALYRDAAAKLFPPAMPDRPEFERWNTIDDVLRDCRAEYLTEGLASLRTLPAGSVDLIWSQAVMEHVRRAEFGPTLVEMRRLLRPGGVASHQIDLKDHLGGKLNSLRFSGATWEGEFFSSSGFYTNRLRASEILALAKEAGLDAEVLRTTRWERIPTPREKLDPAFQRLSDDDLLISDFHVVFRPSPRG